MRRATHSLHDGPSRPDAAGPRPRSPHEHHRPRSPPGTLQRTSSSSSERSLHLRRRTSQGGSSNNGKQQQQGSTAESKSAPLVGPAPSAEELMQRKKMEAAWDDINCPICLESPHNAILLICHQHDRRCRPFMCDTSHRHSNCLDLFRKTGSPKGGGQGEEMGRSDAGPTTAGRALLSGGAGVLALSPMPGGAGGEGTRAGGGERGGGGGRSSARFRPQELVFFGHSATSAPPNSASGPPGINRRGFDAPFAAALQGFLSRPHRTLASSGRGRDWYLEEGGAAVAMEEEENEDADVTALLSLREEPSLARGPVAAPQIDDRHVAASRLLNEVDETHDTALPMAIASYRDQAVASSRFDQDVVRETSPRPVIDLMSPGTNVDQEPVQIIDLTGEEVGVPLDRLDRQDDQVKDLAPPTEAVSAAIAAKLKALMGDSLTLAEAGLLCPYCRTPVIGWKVQTDVRLYLNQKARPCSREGCDFSGAYGLLRNHARSVHPHARRQEADPSRVEAWARLQRQHENEDVLSSLRATAPNARVLGDYVIEDEDDVLHMDGSDSEGVGGFGGGGTAGMADFDLLFPIFEVLGNVPGSGGGPSYRNRAWGIGLGGPPRRRNTFGFRSRGPSGVPVEAASRRRLSPPPPVPERPPSVPALGEDSPGGSAQVDDVVAQRRVRWGELMGGGGRVGVNNSNRSDRLTEAMRLRDVVAAQHREWQGGMAANESVTGGHGFMSGRSLGPTEEQDDQQRWRRFTEHLRERQNVSSPARSGRGVVDAIGSAGISGSSGPGTSARGAAAIGGAAVGLAADDLDMDDSLVAAERFLSSQRYSRAARGPDLNNPAEPFRAAFPFAPAPATSAHLGVPSWGYNGMVVGEPVGGPSGGSSVHFADEPLFSSFPMEGPIGGSGRGLGGPLFARRAEDLFATSSPMGGPFRGPAVGLSGALSELRAEGSFIMSPPAMEGPFPGPVGGPSGAVLGRSAEESRAMSPLLGGPFGGPVGGQAGGPGGVQGGGPVAGLVGGSVACPSGAFTSFSHRADEPFAMMGGDSGPYTLVGPLGMSGGGRGEGRPVMRGGPQGGPGGESEEVRLGGGLDGGDDGVRRGPFRVALEGRRGEEDRRFRGLPARTAGAGQLAPSAGADFTGLLDEAIGSEELEDFLSWPL
eukprot:TRINITY_DN3497_c3_g1_i1.p1 TRINITY_DN3497_c3_g1~~TRINITY_DN3497_c3_g1_i1.p1  ORF type:complete len:1151 (-),score=174.45 TRINITY_DN3497_c3_g1_i1:773-4225(-)